MPDGNGSKLLSENIDAKTWKGYVVRLLEDLSVDVTEIKKTQINKEEFEDLKIKISKVPDNEVINRVMKTLYGNGKEGLVIEVKRLAISHKIKSSFYGVLGGGGFAAIMTLLFFLLRGHI